MKVTISPTDDLTTCLDLRRIVFIDEQGVSEEDELDAYDATATHLLAMDGDRPVGTARIVIKGRVGKIGRVCVLKSHRGAGLGAGLIKAALDILVNDPGITTARLGAQVQAL
ncbi:MAG TPA: GNAT family N-acetyltransferase, partial [Aliiroseovarius sp.]|nr:GNAT family N-acetyltransferase [Aliiroseovarius sp.]